MTEKLLGPLSERPWTERWLTRLLGAVLSSAAYLLCVPWEPRDRPASFGPTAEAAPVTVLGAAALAGCLLPLAAYFGRRDALAWPLLLVAVPPAALLYASLSANGEPPGVSGRPWSLTWASATLVISAGVLVATAVARRFKEDTGDSMEGLVLARPQRPAACGRRV
ncbi:hypothetical protein QFZ75_004808 [Streptomyces sp. V3I8]|uniref:hypothetical protein n=1 Tax=Streptomyces sp. V3I8 TaxID=3042279 RepID=UPI002781FFC5|nr:hypothetical protein [Streptomyces sp. V3I8]MDQ1038392.1 hypothetical protein [Streptomyces sp. V3I8]